MNQAQTPPNKPQAIRFFRKKDLIFVAIILLLAAGFFAFWKWNQSTGATAEVTVGLTGQAQTITQYSLSKDEIIKISGGELPVQLEVLDGRIRFINSLCPDHKCEAFGWLEHEGDFAACLPAGVVVRIAQK